MELKHIKGIGPAKQSKFADAGVDTVEALARADVAELARKTEMSEDQVREFKQKAVALQLMEDVKGIGPQTVVTLAQAGITSLRELYEASAERVAKEAKVARERALEWQDEAQRLAARVRDESKTPEGRRKLLKESADASRVAAKRTQDTLVELYHKARQEGETAVARAQEMREKAPQNIQVLRQRTEQALREAEAKVKEFQEKAPEAAKEWRGRAEAAVKDANRVAVELREKTEQFVRTEAEKARAANEGLLTRIKNRFQKKNA